MWIYSNAFCNTLWGTAPVAPFLLRGKRILQLLCKDDVRWDDPLPQHLRVQWERWRAQLPALEDLTVPRCFKSKDFGEI